MQTALLDPPDTKTIYPITLQRDGRTRTVRIAADNYAAAVKLAEERLHHPSWFGWSIV